jgi:hypothetical protein
MSGFEETGVGIRIAETETVIFFAPEPKSTA